MSAHALPSTFDDLAALPKVELHVHLEGTITAADAVALARANGRDPDEVLRLEDGAYPARYRDFHHFLEVFLAASRQLVTPDDLAAIAAAFARGQAAQRVLYTEVTFTALTHVAGGMEPGPMWQALTDGFAEAPDTRIGVIVDTVRDLGVDAAERTIRLVADAEAPIVALGLTGTEGVAPERAFLRLREAADELGLGVIVHAGETGPAAHVQAALDDLGADRIAHGVAAVDDGALLARLVRDRVPLDVCPSSNAALGVVGSLDEHPLPRLLDAGANATVSSDDPPLFGTSLTDELRHAARLARLTRHDVAELQRRAVRASFAPADVQRELLARIDAWSAASVL